MKDKNKNIGEISNEIEKLMYNFTIMICSLFNT